MEFKTTSTKPSRRAAFTLVELLVSVGIASLLMVVVLSLSLYTTRSIASLTDSVDLGARSRHAIDRMSQKLRQASAINSFSPSAVSVVFKGKTLSYTYDAAEKKLIENEQGAQTTLLENCDRLTFTLYKRVPITNSFTQFPANTTISEGKVIQVSWDTSRTLVSRRSGSAEMASARIVLRAQ
ncbi:MAG TPA: prepilin-type N-terminal cleavage/methylation domain-containing protein [Verrucomicrobiae bacterium]|nr:prepilin-type N-terminal cleavage/methylation domain-containing protein [Verrucomicrobiae bacterium]